MIHQNIRKKGPQFVSLRWRTQFVNFVATAVGEEEKKKARSADLIGQSPSCKYSSTAAAAVAASVCCRFVVAPLWSAIVVLPDFTVLLH